MISSIYDTLNLLLNSLSKLCSEGDFYMFSSEIALGILIPFLGTALGSGCVFFLRNEISERSRRILTGFASGVMLAASVWSLLIPSMENASKSGLFPESLSFIPAVVGFWIGILFLLFLDSFIPHLHQFSEEAEGVKSNLPKTTMMLLAVTIHNIPEGMAVGVVYAGYINENSSITAAGALALSLGIAIQNFPEGAIISTPLQSEGMKKTRSFFAGVLSGAVEPLGAILTIALAPVLVPILPYLLSFAAGAMLYVIIEELIPEMMEGKHSNVAVLAFSAGFTLMMILDVALG